MKSTLHDTSYNHVFSPLRYSMMHVCWNESPEQRPTFLDLVDLISTTLEKEAGYLDLSCSLSWKNLVQGRLSWSTSRRQENSAEIEAFEMQVK